MIDIIRFPVWLLLVLCGVVLAMLYVVVGLPLVLWAIYSGTSLPGPATPMLCMLETFEKCWPRDRSTP